MPMEQSASIRDAMNLILKMENSIQPYAWGSRKAIAQMMNRSFPTEVPEAELWMGAHPKSPSRVWVDDGWQHLDQLIARSPETFLGTEVCARFNATLPYLFKILAVAQPLSIQAHPNKKQALQGFERENLLNIPMDASHRNYKDRQHKPEYLCALTPFWALGGFRTKSEIHACLEKLWPRQNRQDLAILDKFGLKEFFKHLMTMISEKRIGLIEHVIKNAQSLPDPNRAHQWMVRLQDQYPGDAGVLSPALLNLIQLQPGEAMAIESGQLHAYLEGVCIELMANSDNVLRGGLTPKHVDLPELLKVAQFDPYTPEILRLSGAGTHDHDRFYPSQAEEFVLFLIEVAPKQEYVVENRLNIPEILLCTKGEAMVKWQGGAKSTVIEQGRSLFVPAVVNQYTIDGDAVIYKAAVNIKP